MIENLGASGFFNEETPVAEIFTCVGFFMIYFIEEIVHLACDEKVHNMDQEGVVELSQAQAMHIHRSNQKLLTGEKKCAQLT